MGYRFGDYKQYYIDNIKLAAPIIMSHVGQMSVQLADNIMVGRLGALPLAGVSFGGAVFFFLFIFGVGLSLGLTPLVGERFVRGQHRRSAAYLQNSLLLYGLIGVAICALQFAIIPFFGYMGQDQQVIEVALPYYKYMALSMIPFMIFAAFKQFLEGLGNTKVAMWIVITCNIVNIIFNYLFIYGKFGFPALGAEGAGLATFISRCLMPVMIVVYFFSKDTFKRYFKLYNRANFDIKHITTILGVGVPISLQMFMEGGAFSLSTIMVGWIGADALAANQIAMSTVSFAFMMLIGVVSATTIQVSHQMGRRSKEGVRMVASASYHMSLVYSLLVAIIFISFRGLIPQAFTSDQAAVAVASKLLVIAAFFEISDMMQFTSLGILRGMKDVRYTVVAAFVAYILVNLPVAYLLAFPLGLGVNGVWLGSACGLSLAAFLLNRRYRMNMRKLDFR